MQLTRGVKMKFLLKLISIFALIFCEINSYAQISDLKIYYVNGIQNTVEDAKNGASAATTVLSSLTNNTRVLSFYNPTGIYDGSHSIASTDTCNAKGSDDLFYHYDTSLLRWTLSTVTKLTETIVKTAPCMVADLGELTASKLNEENYHAAYQAFVVGNNLANFNGLSQSSAAAFINTYLNNEKPTIKKIVESLTAVVQRDINAGKRVLIIAHSQGNIIANLAWVNLISKLSAAQVKNIRILNVANTHRSSPNSTDITHNSDKEIDTSLRKLGLLYKRESNDCPLQTSVVSIAAQPIPIQPVMQACDFKVVNATYNTNVFGFIASKDNHNFNAAYLSDTAVTRISDNTSTTFKNAFYASTRELLAGMGYFNTPPTAAITPLTGNLYAGTAIVFSGAGSTDAEGAIAAYAWTFGDGGTATGVSPSHTYASAGTYTVGLTVTDAGGLTHSVTRSITVTTAPITCTAPNTLVNGVCTPPAATGLLPDTGITSSQCYAAGSDTLVSCTSAAAIALSPTQDGMVGRDVTSPSNTDGKLGFSYSQVGSYPITDCVKDNITGLTWEGKPASGTRGSPALNPNGTFTNYGDNTAGDASAYVAAVNAAGLCGPGVWRLPTADELLTLMDYGSYGLKIDATWFPNTPLTAGIGIWYWTSSRSVGGFSGSARYVNFYDGFVTYDPLRYPFLVRLVR
jgi:PKD repeat protein